MTSISQKTDERKPRHLELATVLALGATAVLAGNALLIRNTEPALAVSENVASASAFRILTPQAIDRLAGLSGPVAPGEDAATGVSVPADDENVLHRHPRRAKNGPVRGALAKSLLSTAAPSLQCRAD
ncbi:hypothetical protein [Agrobacterium pusense]|uniref:hypothetical protein n=1 Tax=Agrobacterium pusense TaxID=648995 RepID=UPI002FE0FDB5